MSHRVIAGKAKGRRLQLVPGNKTRPIQDRAKEALFSILQDDVPGCYFLDVFAGTGAVGIEALSRGASHARFLDIDRMAIRTIHENLQITGLATAADVIQTDSLAYLRRHHVPHADIVYIAPPQYHGIWKKALLAVDDNPVHLNPNALVVVQIDPDEEEPTETRWLQRYDQRRYGNTLLIFYEYEPETDQVADSDT
ncbi:MAG: 16S rRNA (guanine(966)-N(2))-methyltransferase RsmD [Chloroflexi bacterium]|nr:16S rRNA (guanine(966)-N(2))-methyltransferase RsmD [Chloroflexota bacterium]